MTILKTKVNEMKKTLILFVVSLALFFIFTNTAINVFLTVAIAQEEAREEYIIKKGDTLWDISDTKLEDTFLWPRLWNVNPEIENPDLIYPGNKIRIPSREELMRMMPKPKAVAKPKPRKPKPKVVSEPPGKIMREYIVSRDLYIASGWISDEFPGIGEITSSPLDHKIVGEDEIVYIKLSETEKTFSSKPTESPALLVENNEAGDSGIKFLAIRDIKVVKHPVTGKKMGHQIRVTGILETIEINKDISKAKVIKSFEEINIGDGLIPYQEMEPPYIPEVIRTPFLQGYIVESHTNAKITGEGDIVFLDKGQYHGLEVGDVFFAFSQSPIERPVGTIQIISLQPNTSNAVILKSTQEVVVGTRWGQK
jgi:hypothetical protein